MADQFNYDSFFSANSQESTPGTVRHSKYDFAVAYPDPDNLPLEELIESVRAGFDAKAGTWLTTPPPRATRSCARWWPRS